MYDGYVFYCTKESQQQCLSNKHFTCSDNQTKPAIEDLKIGTIVFLYNFDDRSLLGPFSTLPEGDELDAGAWAEDVDTHIPSEDLKVTWEDLHILRNAPDELPFLNDTKTCKLTTLQTQRALDTLKKGELYLDVKK